jgi:enamine deaminase RidA (YjgF/YER057c/UK114 family)
MSRRVSSGTPCEPVVGRSRVVAAGDAHAQTKQAPANVVRTLERSRIFVADIFRREEYGRPHGEFFGAARPATSMVEVSRLIDPAMLVEIEADACRPGAGA